MIDTLYSDQFLFWSVIFIGVVFLLCFIFGIFFGIFRKNAKVLEEHFDSLFGFACFQGICFVTVLFYIAGLAEEAHNKTEKVAGCYLLAIFVGSFFMITPISIWLFYFVNEIFTSLGLVVVLVVKYITSWIFKKNILELK